eukprot:Gb_09513 [translate_table: standard]
MERSGNKRFYNLRQRNGVARPEDKAGKQPNGQSAKCNIENTLCQSSASRSSGGKKDRNGVNGFHQNGDKNTRKPHLNSRVLPDCSAVVVESKSVEVKEEDSCGFESQDADYSYIPGLDDEVAKLCLAKTSRAEYGKLFSINKRYLALAQSGDLYKIRRENGISEQWVYMLASGQFEWRAFDSKSGRWRRLPNLPSDTCFAASDKESLCAGTHFLVLGREIEGLVIWRYELVTNKWYKGPSMITPRCLFASASCGNFAFVAGGIGANTEFLKSAEKYDADKQRWERLPDMHKRRKLCSGCFMDKRFYVIGGTGEKGENLTCGEFYDIERKTWELIPDMIPQGISSSISQAPPLVAVVNNELYALEASTNQLKFYMKKINKWKVLGEVPVRADCNSGWGVAFKSLGDKLLVIGGGRGNYQYMYGHGISIYTLHPDPNGQDDNWHFVTRLGGPTDPFVFNCAIMSA